MDELDSDEEALRDYLALRDRVSSTQLATLDKNGEPEASHAPLVWRDGRCYLYLSELAGHTQNLRRHPRLGLLLVEEASTARNPFARRRISLQGEASTIARDSDLFDDLLAEFRQRFGKVMDMIEPLPDFHLFCVEISSGRFIRGFGQAYELGGPGLSQLRHIDPSA